MIPAGPCEGFYVTHEPGDWMGTTHRRVLPDHEWYLVNVGHKGGLAFYYQVRHDEEVLVRLYCYNCHTSCEVTSAGFARVAQSVKNLGAFAILCRYILNGVAIQKSA